MNALGATTGEATYHTPRQPYTDGHHALTQSCIQFSLNARSWDEDAVLGNVAGYMDEKRRLLQSWLVFSLGACNFGLELNGLA